MRAFVQRTSSRLRNSKSVEADNNTDRPTESSRESQYQSLPDANISTHNEEQRSEYVTKYKGFNTSITHILHRPESARSDCCSIVCCGLLQSDYNRYILHNRRPPTFRNRLIQYILVPLAFFCIAGYSATHIQDQATRELVTWMFLFLTIGWIIGGCMRTSYKHAMVRRDLLRKVKGISSGVVVNSWDEVDLEQTEREMKCAHYMCGCYGTDMSNDEMLGVEPNETTSDLFSCISSAFAGLFCGRLARTQWQICGICGVAQEGRQIDALVPLDRRRLDYVTFQSYFDYMNPIRKLRAEGNGNLWDHYMALSKLSRMMIKTLLYVISMLLFISIAVSPKYFQWTNVLVFIATFLQAFLILYFVHWHWNRFDISLDAVVKYFACGFVITTSTAICFEMLESLALNIVTYLLAVLVPVRNENNQNAYEKTSKVYDGTIGLFSASGQLNSATNQQNSVFSILFLFCSAYLIAALVEESCKYFGFKMVEHPDFVSDKDLEKAVALGVFDDDEDEDPFECGGGFAFGGLDDGEEGVEDRDLEQPTRETISSRFIDDHDQSNNGKSSNEDGGSTNSKPDVYQCPQKSLNSTGAAITIAMVAVALGFACCENLLYIFFYTNSPSLDSEQAVLDSEIAVLLSRSLFPVHPLCAAIQSIGVCQQQLENDKSLSVGRILFPAILLHGSYDFTLMLFNYLFPADGNDDDAQYEVPFFVNFLPFIFSVAYVVGGTWYYFYHSKKQKVRLQQLDTARDQFQSRLV